MADSLLLSGYELLGGTTNPEYRLTPNFDFGQGDPDTTVISSLLLDGDVVTGERTRNRTITLGVTVIGASRADLSAKVDTLRQIVDSTSYTLQWTPNGGLAEVFDCYRGTTVRERSLIRDQQLNIDLTLTIPAAPFGRTPVAQTVSPPAATVQVDSFDTAPTGATLNTTTKYEGTGSASYTLTNTGGGYYTGSAVSRTISSINLASYPSLTIRGYQSFFGSFRSPNAGGTIALTLGSAGGSTTYTASFTVAQFNWGLISIPLSGGVTASGAGVNLAAVTSWSIVISSFHGAASSSPSTVTFLLDDMRVSSPSSTIASTTRGLLAQIPGVVGSARTPVSLALSGTTMAGVLLHRPPGTQDVNAQILTGITLAASPSTPTVTVPAAGAGFNGTYSVVLGASASLAVSNTVAVTITQKENGTAVATAALTQTYTAPLSDLMLKLGEVTLPLRAIPTDNTLTTYDFAFNHSAGTDTFTDLMLLDTTGQTVFADPPTAAPAVYIDEPGSLTTMGQVLASATDRSAAYGIADTCWLYGGPILFEPGTNKLLVWANAAAPSVTATYYPRWLDERIV